MAVWARLKPGYSAEEVCQRALGMGLHIPGPNLFTPPNLEVNALRLGFASLNEEEMRRTIPLFARKHTSPLKLNYNWWLNCVQ